MWGSITSAPGGRRDDLSGCVTVFVDQAAEDLGSPNGALAAGTIEADFTDPRGGTTGRAYASLTLDHR